MLTCYFCKTPITKLHGKDSDSLAIHHIDGNHSNDVPENRANSHYGCHSRYNINSPKGKAHVKKMREDWQSSPEGKAQIKRMGKDWYSSPEGKAQVKKMVEDWNSSPEGKAHSKKLGKDQSSSPEGKAHLKKWNNSPEGKAHLQKLHAAKLGKHRTEETKAKIRKTKIGVKLSKEHKQALRDGWKKRRERLAKERLEEN